MTRIPGLTLDTGALIAYESNQPRMRALIGYARRTDLPITVPVVVVAEVWRDPRARWLRGLLETAEVESLSEALARACW